MTVRRTYLDHNATAPLRPEARAAMLSALDGFGNPSSIHAEGRRARAVVEAARGQVAALVGAKPAEVVFTSGATEANAWVMAAGWQSIHMAGVEHESVAASARASAARIEDLPIAASGAVSVETLRETLTAAAPNGRGLLTLQLANNETGIVQPVAAVSALAREQGLAVHTDAVQAAGRIQVDFAALGADFLSLSAHKLGGPKGIGALIVRDGVALQALIPGGGQERRRRAGTENVVGIAGFGAAAAAALNDLQQLDRLRRLRDRLESGARDVAPEVVVIGAGAERLVNTSCLALPGTAAEMLVIKLDLAGIAVSAGSACSSGKVGQSHVLAAIGVERELAAGAIRVSLGWSSTQADVEAFLAAWAVIVGANRKLKAVA